MPEVGTCSQIDAMELVEYRRRAQYRTESWKELRRSTRTENICTLTEGKRVKIGSGQVELEIDGWNCLVSRTPGQIQESGV